MKAEAPADVRFVLLYLYLRYSFGLIHGLVEFEEELASLHCGLYVIGIGNNDVIMNRTPDETQDTVTFHVVLLILCWWLEEKGRKQCLKQLKLKDKKSYHNALVVL